MEYSEAYEKAAEKHYLSDKEEPHPKLLGVEFMHGTFKMVGVICVWVIHNILYPSLRAACAVFIRTTSNRRCMSKIF